jgi:hypothetical protein
LATGVAAFFSEGGSLRINNGAASVGRPAVNAAAQAFMTAFPDMVVTMDGVELQGQPRHLSLDMDWDQYRSRRFGADDLLAESKGHFDEAEYARQPGGDTIGSCARCRMSG